MIKSEVFWQQKTSLLLLYKAGHSLEDGAEDRSRTDMRSPSVVFETTVSAIPPLRHNDIISKDANTCQYKSTVLPFDDLPIRFEFASVLV